jgi:hypothetical protein
MSPKENKKLILDHYEAFVHRHDDAAVRKQLAADFVDHEMPAGTPPGPEAALRESSSNPGVCGASCCKIRTGAEGVRFQASRPSAIAQCFSGEF